MSSHPAFAPTLVSAAPTLVSPTPWALTADVDARIEQVMTSAVARLGGDLYPALAPLLAAGGKRLRPALTVRLAADGHPPTPDVLERAAAVELLHCATLVHDDLIDDAELRRGVRTVNASHGVARAVVSGDLLIAAATVLSAGVSPAAGVLIGETLALLCRGQALEEDLQFATSPSSEQLLSVTRLKTGSLVQAACLLGAQAAGLDEPALAAVADFGMDFGVVLQLVDDLLDIVSSCDLAHKPVGVDFFAGTVTLPAALAMRESAELRALFRPGLDERQRDRALTLLRSPLAIAATVRAAESHARSAADALTPVLAARPGLAELAAWPALFLRAQLQFKVERHFQDLVSLRQSA